MKYFLRLVTIFVIIANASAQWKPLNKGISFCEIQGIGLFEGRCFISEKKTGVYYSDNFGGNWKLSNNGLPTKNVYCFTKVNDRIFAGTTDKGLFFSDDEGMTWTESNDGINVNHINVITGNDKVIIAGSSYGGGVYVSFDNGLTWTLKNYIQPNIQIRKLMLDDDTVYASTDNGLYRSVDFGNNWTGVGLDVAAGPTTLQAIVKNKMLMVNNNQLFISENKGMNWINKGRIGNYINFSSLSIFDDELYATTDKGIYLSKDWGDTWTEVFKELNPGEYKNLYIYKNLFYILSLNILYKSTDFGQTWEDITEGLPSLEVNNIHFTDNNVLLKTTKTSFFTSNNNCQSWEMDTLFPDHGLIKAFEHDGNNIYVSVDDIGIYKSEDNGKSWELRNNGLPVLASADKMIIKDHIIYTKCTLTENYSKGIYISVDSGNTWKWLRKDMPDVSPDFNNIAVVNGDVFIYLRNNGVYKYPKDEQKWVKVIYFSQGQGLYDYFIESDNKLFLVNGDYTHNIYWSDDNGETWVNTNTDINFSNSTAFIVTDKFFIMGSSENGVWFSKRNENKWIEANKGLPSLKINQLVVHDNAIYACTGNGLYYVEDIDNFDIITDVPVIPQPDNNLSIFPNPATAYKSITLTGFEDCNNISMYDLMGRTIYKTTISRISNDLITIDLSKLNIYPGTYFVVTDNGKSAKFVVTD